MKRGLIFQRVGVRGRRVRFAAGRLRDRGQHRRGRAAFGGGAGDLADLYRSGVLAHPRVRQFVGRGYPPRAFTWTNVRGLAKQEWPLAQASFPPAIAVTFASALGASDSVAAWVALCVAVAGQVLWAVIAASKIHWTTRLIVVSGIINLLLGLAIIGLKTLVAAH
ncbi:hypothetical protein [Nonomuraea sp. NPDC046570]|uniref:hypothetical protein n=1 Tax=Nonomuraea sp. NPDC046570 TaxID=3155255 RepID=UPI0033E4C6D5